MPELSRLPVAGAPLSADLKARSEDVEDTSDVVPNVFMVLAHRPDEWRAFFSYHDADPRPQPAPGDQSLGGARPRRSTPTFVLTHRPQ
jgi:hypothetical protein